MVPFFKILLPLAGLLQVIACFAIASPFRSGFHLPDSIEEITIKYKTIGKLIILPVSINDSIDVNLVLDTGTRNLVLFGKRFKKVFEILPDRKVQFSGLGNGSPVFGNLSINNKVEINSVIGLDIPVVVVPSKNLFGAFVNIHGVIGYEIFQKFEVEINPLVKEITFRSPLHKRIDESFVRTPMRIKDCKPILDCEIFLRADQKHLCDLLLDTGSEFGLLIKSKENLFLNGSGGFDSFARGFNGSLDGVVIPAGKVKVHNITFDVDEPRMIHSPFHNYASIGMDVLSQYIVVLNYAKGYIELKRLT